MIQNKSKYLIENFMKYSIELDKNDKSLIVKNIYLSLITESKCLNFCTKKKGALPIGWVGGRLGIVEGK